MGRIRFRPSSDEVNRQNYTLSLPRTLVKGIKQAALNADMPVYLWVEDHLGKVVEKALSESVQSVAHLES